MRKTLLISCALSLALMAESIEIQKVVVESGVSNETQIDVDSEEIRFTRQQDLAEILFETLPEINMVRASSIGNDIVLRGFKRDDINVLIDGAKIYGGCPNRMDPPSMHISAAQIESVVIKEGPFDVENFGSMGALIDVKTKDPQKGVSADLSYTYGSFDFNKVSLSANAGDEKIKALIGFSKESSNQYRDGDGKSLVDQQWSQLAPTDANRYQTSYKDAQAYSRSVMWSKFLVNPAEDHEIRVSLYRDKATDVLYPSFQMDAQLDETAMINLDYSVKNIARYSKRLDIKTYYSHVRHDMGTEFRLSGLNPMTYRTHRVRSTVKGARVANSFDAADMGWKIGVDGSLRNWNGMCISEPLETPRQVRIPDVDTKNRALFLEGIKSYQKLTVKFGARYDKTDVRANNLDDPTIVNIADIQNYYQNKDSRSFNDFSANVTVNYTLNEKASLFVGIGQSIRVPDAQELYFIGYMNGNWSRKGNPDLKETKNREIDLGIEGSVKDVGYRVTVFYSDLKDYIYAYKTNAGNLSPTAYYLTWANIDAHIYGADLSLAAPLGEEYILEAGVAYQRGKKDSQPTAGMSDTDLAQIPPLKTRVALSYDGGDYFARAELIAVDKYRNYDSDNGEQEISGWVTMNLKASKEITKNMVLNLGVDNLFDATYAVNNTYVGRALIGGSQPLLINEPGRYLYANLNLRF